MSVSMTPASPGADSASPVKTGVIALQLGLLIVAIYQFDIVSRAFLHLSILTFFGFLVHAHLSRRYQLTFFLFLSVCGIFLVMGPVNGAWVLAVGSALIAICHLPMPFSWRVAAVVLVGLAFIPVRLADEDLIMPVVVVPIVASMFMFRMIIYLHDLRAEKSVSGAWSFSYFFMLPNVVFPLFPLVDYKQFRSLYFNEDPYAIYQRGVNWIFRGIYHLLLYRLVYLYLTIDPAMASGTADLIQYSVTSFLLYLRVSGTFHIATGLLLLFGFNLPETHHRYYLASSFTDFWRRINIYWKEFMRRIVFYPVNFRLRRYGNRTALVWSTMAVFFVTWVLHSYQWFWLTGTLLLEPHDAIFWGLLAVLVSANVLYEDRFGAERSFGGKGHWTASAYVALAMRTAATFIVMALLWGLWSSDSLTQWVEIWSGTGRLWLWLSGSVIALFLGSFLLQQRERKMPQRPMAQPRRTQAMPAWRAPALVAVGAMALIFAGFPKLHGALPSGVGELAGSFQTSQLNLRDRKKLEQGYYEHLMSPNITSGLWELYTKPAVERQADDIPYRLTDNILRSEFVPGVSVHFKGALFSINSFGMRDREYSLEKPPGVIRVALLGSSHVIGVGGVGDDDIFAARVEKMLNETGAGQYEILNFAVPGGSLQHLYVLEHKVAKFRPDVVMLVGHFHDDEILSRNLVPVIREGRTIPYASIVESLKAANIHPSLPKDVIERRLAPILGNLQQKIHAQISEECRRQGAQAWWVYLPMVYAGPADNPDQSRLDSLRSAGFSILSLSGVYDGYASAELQISEQNTHPSALGHRLVAERLYAELQTKNMFMAKGPSVHPPRLMTRDNGSGLIPVSVIKRQEGTLPPVDAVYRP